MFILWGSDDLRYYGRNKQYSFDMLHSKYARKLKLRKILYY
jgi:hypothetical protein